MSKTGNPRQDNLSGVPTALLMLSGGIDSVAALHKHLIETDEPIRTHHVKLLNWEGRARFEALAVKKALAWARRNGHANRIIHSESTTDYGTLRYIVADHHTWGHWAAIVLANPRSAGITRIIRTMHIDDSIRDGAVQPDKQGRIREAWEKPIELIAKRGIEFVWPLREMTKAQVIQSLPRELLEVCWYCRRPKRGRPCNECRTCQQVNAATKGEERAVDPNAARASREAAARQPKPAETPTTPSPTEQPGNDQVIELGGGWYVWRGEKYHGKAALEAAQAKGG